MIPEPRKALTDAEDAVILECMRLVNAIYNARRDGYDTYIASNPSVLVRYDVVEAAIAVRRTSSDLTDYLRKLVP